MSPENGSPSPQLQETEPINQPEYRYYELEKYAPYEDPTERPEDKQGRPEKPWGFKAKVENRLVTVNGKNIIIQVLSNFQVLEKDPDSNNPASDRQETLSVESYGNPASTPDPETKSDNQIYIYHTGGMQSLGPHHIADTLHRYYLAENTLDGFQIQNLTLLSHPWGSPTTAEDLSLEECGQAVAQCIPKPAPNTKTVLSGLSSGASVVLATAANLEHPPEALVLMEPVGFTKNSHLVQKVILDAWGAFKDNGRKFDNPLTVIKETLKQLRAGMAISDGAPRNLYRLLLSLIKQDPEVTKILSKFEDMNKPTGLDIDALKQDSTKDFREKLDPKTHVIVQSIIGAEVSYVFKEIDNYINQHPEIMFQLTEPQRRALATRRLFFKQRNPTTFLSINARSHLVIGSDQKPIDQIAQALHTILNPST